jgi:WD40 repeat protein
VKAQLAALSLSQDGQLLAAAFGSGAAEAEFMTYLWGFSTRENVCRLRGSVNAFGPDGSVLAIPDPVADSKMNLWSTETCEVSYSLQGIPYPYGSALAFSPNGQFIVTGRENIQLWDVTSGELLHETDKVPNGYVDVLTFSPNGRFLLSTSPKSKPAGQATITLWGIDP